MKKKIIELIKEIFFTTCEMKVNNKYLSRIQAIEILKNKVEEELENKGIYNNINIKLIYETLVIYNKEYAWFIKFKYNSNIYKCLINAENFEFILIDNTFNLREIRLVTDDEFLYYIHTMNCPSERDKIL